MKRVLAVVLALLSVLCFSSCGKKQEVTINTNDIHAICELATIKCYFNNVGKIVKEPDATFQKKRVMWIEYEGEAVIGLDMAGFKMDTTGNKVTITLPEAKILSIRPIPETLTEKSYVVSADGLIVKNKISSEDQRKAILKGQEEMKAALENNTALFTKAKHKAMELIENYVKQFGKMTEAEYEIDWK